MLRRLHIRNLAVVEDVTVELDAGLNVLTGSTGAGKSLILSAVNLLLGEKASADVIRPRAEAAEVEAEFDAIPRGAFPEIEAPEDVLIVRRTVKREGRSHASISGRSVPVRELGALCARLIEPHGQNEQFRLKNPEHHIRYLDAFADHNRLIAAYASSLAAYRNAESALRRFEERIALLREKQELLAHRVEEITRAEITPGEKQTLERKLELMANAERIHGAIAEACEVIYDADDAVVGNLARVQRGLEGVSGVDEELGEFAASLGESGISLADLTERMRAFMERVEFDPTDLERTQQRLELILDLERRYRMETDELIAQGQAWRAELDGLVFEDEERGRLKEATSAAATDLSGAAAALSASRRKAARKLDRSMTVSLGALMLKGATFRTDIAKQIDENGRVSVGSVPVTLFEDGVDIVRFLVRTNPGHDEGALERIASTGELSRIALSLKQETAGAQPGTLLVFDEIDAGVGADLGDVIAENLLALSRRFQIICITHMPQIAARGDRHLVVAKQTRDGYVAVGARPVEGDARLREVARMLGGEKGSDHRLALANELLRRADETRKSIRVRP